MIVRQLADLASGTLTYLLFDPQTRDAVLVDPVREQVDRDAALVRELGLTLRYAVDTHLAYDHVTGSGALRARLGAEIIVPAGVDAPRADHFLAQGDTIEFGRQALEVRTAAGHAGPALLLVMADRSAAFTGHTLLVRQVARCDLDGGDPGRLYDSVQDQLFSLPSQTVVWPGCLTAGYTSSTIAEERAFNPFLGEEVGRDEFIRAVEQRELATPADVEATLALNRKLGHTEAVGVQPGERRWAPIKRTATGVPEVLPGWVLDEGTKYRVIDVRHPDEFSGELGHIPGSELVPLDRLHEEAHGWNRRAALITVCRSGGRSGRAAEILQQMGFQRIASMRGGMSAWAGAGYPIQR